MKQIKEIKTRKTIQSIMWWLLPFICIAGIYYHYLGYIVLSMMITFFILSAFKGRYWCGWLCPRGSFLERIVSKISMKNNIPEIFKNLTFRWIVFGCLMGFMIFRLIKTNGSLDKIGFVFVTMCILTSLIAIPIGIIFKPRTWCVFCPMGLLQGLIGKNKYLIKISNECKECGICKRACPVETSASTFKEIGKVRSIDCIKCLNCTMNCPKNAVCIENKKV